MRLNDAAPGEFSDDGKKLAGTDRDASRLSALETAKVALAAVGPLIAKGVIVRRPPIVRLLAATGDERPAVTVLQALRRRYGGGPVLLRLPVREQAIILSADDARRVLAESPDPFQTDSNEKHAALAHFEPAGSLISRGRERRERRALNERVLESGCPVHRLGERFGAVVAEEFATLIERPALSWGMFKDAWFRIVRRCVFGDAAADDAELIEQLARLCGRANWTFLMPKDRTLRARVLSRIAALIHAAEPNTLARLAKTHAYGSARPEDQIAQWLFAFDAAGIATFRTLAVLASAPSLARRACAERSPERSFLRACVLESVRLWPTTPAVLRQTDRDIRWGDAMMPAETGVLIHLPFLHRDAERLPFADRFAPEVWLSGDAERWGLFPFSGGPAECPARNLVLLLASTSLHALLMKTWTIPPERALDLRALPPTFDHFSLTLRTPERPSADSQHNWNCR